MNADKIENNINGKIIFDNIEYFFNLNNNVLRIFFNYDGIKTVANFNKKYFPNKKLGWIYGQCFDDKSIAFALNRAVYSAHPDKYAEYIIIACIKENFHSNSYSKNNILEEFNKYNGIQISGDLLNKMTSIYNIDSKSLDKEKITLIDDVDIKLTDKLKSKLSVTLEKSYNNNSITYDAKLNFSLYKSQKFNKIITIYEAIKNFIDLIACASNTDFNFQLLQKMNKQNINFASMKIYHSYRNICNRDKNEIVQIENIKDNLVEIFQNLNNVKTKYSLCFLPIDNDEYYTINYSSIQNIVTAVELACDLENKFDKIKKNYKGNQYGKVKAQIIFNWCKKYNMFYKDKFNYGRGFFEPYYKLTTKKIQSFRQLRNDITHRANGVIDKETVNCYNILKLVLLNYIFNIDPNNNDNRDIVN